MRSIPAAFLGVADFLGKLISQSLQLFGLRLHGLAFVFERIEFFFRKCKGTRCKACNHVRELLAQHIDVEHGLPF